MFTGVISLQTAVNPLPCHREAGQSRLRRHLYDLRRALPPAPEDQPWLLIAPQTVQWNPAARSKHLPTAVLQQQLAASQQLLADPAQNRPARHHSLTAALQWSYDLLSAPEKQLLQQLAHFPGSFSLAAVCAICFQQSDAAIDTFNADVFNQLTQLADRHFIFASPHPCAAGVLRFDSLRTIRHFLLERPSSPVDSDWRLRYVNYHASIIWPLTKEWQSAVSKWRLWLGNEAENVHQALNWAIAAGNKADFALPGVKIVTGMVPYWETAVHLTEATFQIERFAPLLPHCPRDVQVRSLRAAGAIADMAGIPDDAAFVYRERALRLAQQLEDRDLICLCLDAYGSSANRRGAFLSLSQKFNIGWPPYYQDGFAQELAKFRQQLTPAAYALAWDKGARLSSEAVAFAHQTIID